MSDAQLYATFRQFESDMEEMRSAGETDEADVLYQRAMIKAGAARGNKGKDLTAEGDLLGEIEDEGHSSVSQQITAVEELLRKLNLVKRERQQTLKDLKEKVSYLASDEDEDGADVCRYIRMTSPMCSS